VSDEPLKTIAQVETEQVAKIESEILRTANQRAVNTIWEVTQAVIALSVTLSTLYAAVMLVLSDKKAEAAFLLLSNAFFLVVGFYFGRTNHQKMGGIGPNEAGR
jgi:hypothetical protein